MKHLLLPLLATTCVTLASAAFAAEPNPSSAPKPAVTEKAPRPAPSLVQRVVGNDEFIVFSIPILFILVGGGWLALHTWCDFRKRRLLIEFHHRERMTALEKGLDLPPLPADLINDKEEPEPPAKPGAPLEDGLWWVGIGIGLAVWLSFSTKPWAHPALAAIPIGIGLAQLIYYCLKGRAQSRP